MISNFQKHNFFTLVSTFARSMIEVFIPIYLYTIGFGLDSIFLYFLIMLLISAVICIPLSYLGTIIKYKWLIFIGAIFFGLTNIYLFNMTNTILSLWKLALFYSLYRRCYWIGKRYYELNVVPKDHMANNVSKVIIVTQIATIFASYFGAILINNVDKNYSIFVAVIIFMISIIPLMMIDEPKSTHKFSIKEFQLFENIPKKDMLAMILYEFLYIASFAFPLYLFLHVKDNFEYIGIFNIFVGISSMIFVYFFSKKMDKDKYNYLLVSGLLLGATLILKLNLTMTIAILAIGILEGIFSKMYDVGYTRDVYFLGCHFDRACYNAHYEIVQNFSRLAIFMIIFTFTQDLKIILYICIIGIIISSFIKFDDGKGGYK